MITIFSRHGVQTEIGWSAISIDLEAAYATAPAGALRAVEVQRSIASVGMTWDGQACYGSSSAPTWNMTRRSAALHLLLNTPPAGDGSVTQNEEQSLLGCYAGILVGGTVAFPRRTMNMMLLLNTLPPGDGTISQADRQDVAWHYGGILAGAAPTGAPKFIPEDALDESIL